MNTTRTPMNATTATTATLEHLADYGWDLLTNRGYASRAAQRIIQRRLRQAGYRFFFTLHEDGPAQWGLLAPDAPRIRENQEMIVGVTLDHCAHQMGMGNAKNGWKDFWNWR